MSDVLTEANRENIKAKAIALYEMMCIYRDAGFTEKQAFTIILAASQAAKPDVSGLSSASAKNPELARQMLETLLQQKQRHAD